MDNRISIYLCDDDKTSIEKIKSEINRLLGKKRSYEITEFENGRDLIRQWNTAFADVVFLDIDMPEISGFETASILQKGKPDTLIIFVTSHEDQVYHSWVFQPFWFVRKSHIDDLEIVLPRLLSKIDTEREKKKCLFHLAAENCIAELDINSLIYIESFRHDIIIYDKNKEPLRLRCRISDAEKQLCPLHIIRIQNGILVNCRFISKITSRDVILTDGKKLYLSRNRIDYVKDKFQEFVRSRRL